ncbi:hypothetical protein DSL72_001364 [Monilinia vaccinii-corymbosi]|uniref:Uncharacterized protein n=1 Tax=Monilinia vaccinii-corymbosi TaxID=61207 RepID=A0A8A3P1N2_9HELO|nr:hypothetical protein DSL72_001364 [Monilinia vaccinii-corymbosi]
MIVMIPLHTSVNSPVTTLNNPLPKLLQTPSGLALLELQGTINLPEPDLEEDGVSGIPDSSVQSLQTPIGRLIFPEYDPGNPDNTKWMKRVYLYVGKHQRLTGEVKKLPRAFAVIRKKDASSESQANCDVSMQGVESNAGDELEIVEIVKWKILFSTRPEPVGAMNLKEPMISESYFSTRRMFIELSYLRGLSFHSFLTCTLQLKHPTNIQKQSIHLTTQQYQTLFNMKSILSLYSSLLLTLLMGISLSDTHTLMGSKGAVKTSNKYSSHVDRPITLELRDTVDTLTSTDIKQPSITTSISSLLVPSIQNLAFLATISTLGGYTPAFVGIGIMTSHVQASVGPNGGLSTKSSWNPAPKKNHTRRRAHPRDVYITGPDIEDRNSYHVAGVLVKKFEEIIRGVSGKKGDSTDVDSHNPSANPDDQLHPPNLGFPSGPKVLERSHTFLLLGHAHVLGREVLCVAIMLLVQYRNTEKVSVMMLLAGEEKGHQVDNLQPMFLARSYSH